MPPDQQEVDNPMIDHQQAHTDDESSDGEVAVAKTNHNNEWTNHVQIPDDLDRSTKLASIGDAISHVLEFAGNCYRVSKAKLHCRECNRLYQPGSKEISVAEEEYYDELGKDGHCWPVNVVRTFGWLKAHETHNPNIIYDDYDLHLPSNSCVKIQNLTESECRIISVAAKSNTQFVVIEVRPDDRFVIVYDGSSKENEDLKQWEEHVDKLMARYGISRADEGMRWIMRHHKLTDFIPEMHFRDEDERDRGPVACRVLWERMVHGEIDRKYGKNNGLRSGRVSRDAEDFSKICMNEMKAMMKKEGFFTKKRTSVQEEKEHDDDIDVSEKKASKKTRTTMSK